MTTPDAPTSGGKSLDFTKKAGPFPLYVWVAAVGVIAYLYWRSRSAASAASAAQTGTGTTDTAGSPLTDQSGGVGAGPGGWAYQPPAATTPTASTITDNNSWATSAEQYLLSLNYSPALVDSAIRDYISGNTLQPNEWAIISQALKGVGPLPTPLPGAGPPPIVNPIVPTPPPPPPPRYNWGTVGGHVSPTAGWGVIGPKAG